MKLSKEQIDSIQRDCDARARRAEARAVDALLEHNPKRTNQRTRKPLEQHDIETSKDIA